MELKKEVREVNGVEKDVYVDEEGNIVEVDADGNPISPVGKDGVKPAVGDKESVNLDVDETGVPWKNRAMEHKRKLKDAIEEIARLKEAGYKTPVKKIDRVKKYREELEKDGYSQLEISEKMKMLQIAIDEANDRVAEQLGTITPIKENVNATKREKMLDELVKDAELGEVVKLHRKDIEKELESIPLQYDIPIETVEAVVGRVLWKKKAFISSSERKGKKILDDNEMVSETGHPSKTKIDGMDVRSNEFQDYVSSQGFDISTPEKRTKVIKAFKAKKELDKVKNQE